jgi:hypothetical protein
MDVTRGKVYNGYGQLTSKLSVTNIGQYNLEAEASGQREEMLKKAMQKSADVELARGKRDHPSKLNLHMQKAYPATLSRLKEGDLTRAKTPPELKTFNWNKPFERAVEEKIVPLSKTQQIVDESSWNLRKREFNKSLATNAQVNNIINGTSHLPINERTGRPEFPIFPAKGTHNQLMGIDGKLKGRDAFEPAPQIAKRNVWLGDNVGWENNRNLVATRKEFEDGKIVKWPNPENWNRNPEPLWG